jgi:KDO2-lipid IV(A) lauroyltransferase
MPLCVLHLKGWFAGWLVFVFSGVYRRRFLANARRAGLNRRQWSCAVGEAGKTILELPRLWLGRPVRVLWSGQELVAQALAQHRGVLFLTPHLGCFEITARAYADVFGATQAPMTVLFRPPKKAWLREWVLHARAREGLRTAETSMAGVRQMLRALKNGESVGLLPDQVPPAGQGVWAPFFGQPAYTMTLSVRLAQQTGACVLLAWGERLSWGRGYRVHVERLPRDLPQDPSLAAAVINGAMEDLIRRCPQQYLWAYARYKDPRED